MRKLFFGTILLAMAIFPPAMTIAGVDVSVGISIPLPPAIVFEAPPDVIALPDANGVYAVPGISIDLFFWNGFWWRPWEGRWYRSPYYDRDWVYYNAVPQFYFYVDPYWRGYYQNHNWHGHIWNYQPIPHAQLQHNWKGWQGSRYWEKKKTWNVQGYTRKPQQQQQVLRQQRQQMYQQRPEVQQHQQFQRQQRQPQMQQQPQPQRQQGQPQMQQQPQPERQQGQPQMQQQHQPQRQQGAGESHPQPRGHEGMGEGRGR